jgi:hypothetical protein
MTLDCCYEHSENMETSIRHIFIDQNDAVIPLNELTVAKAKEYCRYRERKKVEGFWYTTCNESIQTNLKRSSNDEAKH